MINPYQSRILERYMDINERKHVSKAINFFWGPNITTPHTVTTSAAVVAYGALQQASKCSTAMDFVPRPMASPSNTYIIQQIAMIGKRLISGDDKIYHVCKATIGVKYKTEISLALMGI